MDLPVETSIDNLGLHRTEAWVERPDLVNFEKDDESITPVLGRYTASCL